MKIFLSLLIWAFVVAPAIAVLNGTAAPDGLAVSANLVGLVVLSLCCFIGAALFLWRAEDVDTENPTDIFNEQSYLSAILWYEQMKGMSKYAHAFNFLTIAAVILTSAMIGNGLYTVFYAFAEVFLISQMERLYRKGAELSKYYEIVGNEVVPTKHWNMPRMSADYDRFTEKLTKVDRITKSLAESRQVKDHLDPFHPTNTAQQMFMQSERDDSDCVSRSRNECTSSVSSSAGGE